MPTFVNKLSCEVLKKINLKFAENYGNPNLETYVKHKFDQISA